MKSVSRLLLYSSWMKEVLNVLNWNEELFSLSGIRHEINLETSLRGNRKYGKENFQEILVLIKNLTRAI